MNFGNLAALLVGFTLLLLGAEWLVRGGSKLASRLGVPPLIVGLTIVAFGTSAPELSVSLGAVLSGRTDVAIGNAVGSNIFNTFAILGVSACLAPLLVTVRLIRIDVPVMIAAASLVFLLARDGSIDRLEGGVLFLTFAIYTAWLILAARQGSSVSGDPVRGHWIVDIGYICVGLALLTGGSSLLVQGATAIAQHLGISDFVVGLTVVAAGTSLPEAATSILATIRGERDIAVGNVVGSNIFNLLVVIGLPAALASGGLPVNTAAIEFDFPVVILSSLACLPVFFTRYRIERWEGTVFVAYYFAYVLCLYFGFIQSFEDVALFAFPIAATILIHLLFIHPRKPEKDHGDHTT